MQEKIYSTPRTYGSPTGLDFEVSHFPNYTARLAEKIVMALLEGGDTGDSATIAIATRACSIAQDLMNEWQLRGWMLKVTPAPGLDPDYGKDKGDGAAP